MADTFGSSTVNGQMIPVLQGVAFIPNNAAGPSFAGTARPPATIPSGVGSNIGVGATSAVSGAGASPMSATHSPLPVLLVSLVAGLLILRYVHWRKGA
jgi:hypothetical protein